MEIDFVALGLQLCLLGLELLPQLSEVALTFIGRGDCLLESNDRNLGGGGEGRAGGRLGRCRRRRGLR